MDKKFGILGMAVGVIGLMVALLTWLYPFENVGPSPLSTPDNIEVSTSVDSNDEIQTFAHKCFLSFDITKQIDDRLISLRHGKEYKTTDYIIETQPISQADQANGILEKHKVKIGRISARIDPQTFERVSNWTEEEFYFVGDVVKKNGNLYWIEFMGLYRDKLWTCES